MLLNAKLADIMHCMIYYVLRSGNTLCVGFGFVPTDDMNHALVWSEQMAIEVARGTTSAVGCPTESWIIV